MHFSTSFILLVYNATHYFYIHIVYTVVDIYVLHMYMTAKPIYMHPNIILTFSKQVKKQISIFDTNRKQNSKAESEFTTHLGILTNFSS